MEIFTGDISPYLAEVESLIALANSKLDHKTRTLVATNQHLALPLANDRTVGQVILATFSPEDIAKGPPTQLWSFVARAIRHNISNGNLPCPK